MICHICRQTITSGEDIYISYKHKFIGPTDNDIELDLSEIPSCILIRHACCKKKINDEVTRSNALGFLDRSSLG